MMRKSTPGCGLVSVAGLVVLACIGLAAVWFGVHVVLGLIPQLEDLVTSWVGWL